MKRFILSPLLFLLFALGITSCKKNPVSSPSEEGTWLRKYRYSISIGGSSKIPEDANNPVSITFASGNFNKYEMGKATVSGPYIIAHNYPVSYGSKGTALVVNNNAIGEFRLGQASPDSITIGMIVNCFDCGGGEVYYRVK